MPHRSASGPRPSAAASASDTTVLGPALTPEGRTLLASLTDQDVADPLAASSRLRSAGHAPELVAAVLTQASLRRAARPKLGDLADTMVFTRDGLEQATRRVVAEARAERLRDAGVRSVADLGCGIAADALVYARAGIAVTAVERDPVVGLAAAANLASVGVGVRASGAGREGGVVGEGGASVVVGDAVAWAREHADEVDALWFDPARRQMSSSGAARVFDPEAFSPPLSFVLGLAGEGRALGVKLGPGLPHEHLPAEAEAEWVSVDGDVVEVALWFGPLARNPGRRVATVVTTRGPGRVEGSAEVATLVGGAPGSPELAAVGPEGLEGVVGHVLHEPDGAVIRAGLVTDLGASWGGSGGGAGAGEGGAARLLDPHLAYLTTPEPVPGPFSRGYRVVAVHPLDVKGLRRWVRERGVTRLDIKKRGVDVAPETLRRQLLAGGRGAAKGVGNGGAARSDAGHATLVLARVGDRRVALEVDPIRH